MNNRVRQTANRMLEWRGPWRMLSTLDKVKEIGSANSKLWSRIHSTYNAIRKGKRDGSVERFYDAVVDYLDNYGLIKDMLDRVDDPEEHQLIQLRIQRIEKTAIPRVGEFVADVQDMTDSPRGEEVLDRAHELGIA